MRLRGTRVIVAGAGLAGLTAARDLAREGASVRVFEAQERLGGRVWTSRDAPIAPCHGELGGELIDGDHAALRALCRDLRLPLVRVLLRGFAFAAGEGRRVRIAEDFTPWWKAFAGAFRPEADAFEHAGKDWSSSAAAMIARLRDRVAELLGSRSRPALGPRGRRAGPRGQPLHDAHVPHCGRQRSADLGARRKRRPWLARSAGRVAFAGCHPSRDFQGYMNGAVESGLRAAGDIRLAVSLAR